MKQLTVLHIDFEKTWRGGQQQLFWLAEGLTKKGYRNVVVCSPDSALQKKCADAGFDSFAVKMLFELDPFAVFKTAGIIDKVKPDIVHLHSAHAHTIGLLASKLSKHRPKVVSSRRVDFHIRSGWKYRSVDRIIAISEGVKKVLLSDGIDAIKISVVHSGVDLTRFEHVNGSYLYDELGIKRGTKIVGIVASLAPHKDHINFLQAASIIRKTIPSAKFLVVGDGGLREKLVGLSEKLGIRDSVVFAGFRKDVPQILSIFNIFVLSSYLEGLCTSLIDASASGVPIVATNVGGVGEIVVNGINGLLVPSRDPEALAAATVNVLQNEHTAKTFAAAGREKAKDFSKEKMIDGTERVYSELI